MVVDYNKIIFPIHKSNQPALDVRRRLVQEQHIQNYCTTAWAVAAISTLRKLLQHELERRTPRQEKVPFAWRVVDFGSIRAVRALQFYALRPSL